MRPAVHLLAWRIRDVVFLALAGAGVFGCSACPIVGAEPPPDAPSELMRVCYHPDETPVVGQAFQPDISDRQAGKPDLPPIPAEGPPPALNMPAVVPPNVARPLQILAMSGGVAGAPFTAGVLVGWSQTGTRPTFDQVTGISSGSLIGAYAFLGSKYDAQMQQLILTMQTSDLIKFRPLRCMLCEGSFGSAKPAERLICRAFDDNFIADLRCSHAQGRRLHIGTMNIETKRLTIWDIGAIASSGRPDANDLVRKVLLAAISWPGAVPPVPFDIEVNGHCYREEHCDAGSVAMALPPIGPLPSCPIRSDLYVFANRKLYSDPEPVPKRAFHRMKPSVSAFFEALTRANVCHLYSICRLSGMRFHLMALPQDYIGEAPSISHLYPKEAHRLFEIGYHIGTSGPCWRYAPPGAEPGEQLIPRDGREIRQ